MLLHKEYDNLAVVCEASLRVQRIGKVEIKSYKIRACFLKVSSQLRTVGICFY